MWTLIIIFDKGTFGAIATNFVGSGLFTYGTNRYRWRNVTVFIFLIFLKDDKVGPESGKITECRFCPMNHSGATGWPTCVAAIQGDLFMYQPYREWLTYVPAIQGVTYLLYVPAMQGVTYLRASHTGSDLPTCQPCQTARKTRVVNWLIIRLFRNLSRCKERENSLYKYSFSLGMHRIIRSFSYSYPAEYRTLKVM